MSHLKVLQLERDELDRVEIATPCEVPWDSLVGDDRVRHCGRCRQNVYNVEAMPRTEALRLIERGEGRLCWRLFRRPDGTVVTSDCWSRLKAARRRGTWAFLAVLVVAGWAEIAALFVGLSGLRRWTGSPGAACLPRSSATGSKVTGQVRRDKGLRPMMGKGRPPASEGGLRTMGLGTLIKR